MAVSEVNVQGKYAMNSRKENHGMIKCSLCGKHTDRSRMFMIDGKWMCARCLYGNVCPVEIYPIGVVHNSLARSQTDFGVEGDREDISRIELLPSQVRFMYKIEDEQYLAIVYYLNKARPVLSVFNRGLDGKEVGVFASRTPDRLSRIGIQDVRLVRVEKTTLFVKGLDAVDGTPVLDIKLRWHATMDENDSHD